MTKYTRREARNFFGTPKTVRLSRHAVGAVFLFLRPMGYNRGIRQR